MTPHERNYRTLIRRSNNAKLESRFDFQLKRYGIKGVEKNYRFHPTRRWEIDRALPEYKIGAEIQGGTFGRPVYCHRCKAKVLRQLKTGRWMQVREGYGHGTATGLQRDYEKLNAAQMLGWIVIFVSGEMILNETGIQFFQSALRSREFP